MAGQQVICFDSPVKHDFDFTSSMSFFVRCGSREELKELWGALSEGGVALMPLGDYECGFFGWVNDRIGVAWQLSFED